jgi:hypothetical protein
VALDSVRNLAFCGAGGVVYVLDVRDPSQPNELSEAIHTRGVVFGLAYQANRLYIADDAAGLEIWDVATPASPVLLSRVAAPSDL